MSFEDSSALESQPTNWRREDDPTYRDDPEFDHYSRDLSDKLFGLTSNVARLSTQVGLLGTKRETERVRERVRDMLDETSATFKELGDGLRKVQTWEDLNPAQKFTQGKLAREFQATLTEFQHLQRNAIEKERASASAARSALEQDQQQGPTSPSQQGGQQQTQQQQQEQLRLAPQSEVDFQESLIIEREGEIRNIEQSVNELNELFRDVAHMVSEQGEQLDIISENVQGVRDDTRGADVELRQASRHQRNARNKACCLLLILAVVLTVIILAVVVG